MLLVLSYRDTRWELHYSSYFLENSLSLNVDNDLYKKLAIGTASNEKGLLCAYVDDFRPSTKHAK